MLVPSFSAASIYTYIHKYICTYIPFSAAWLQILYMHGTYYICIYTCICIGTGVPMHAYIYIYMYINTNVGTLFLLRKNTSHLMADCLKQGHSYCFANGTLGVSNDYLYICMYKLLVCIF